MESPIWQSFTSEGMPVLVTVRNSYNQIWGTEEVRSMTILTYIKLIHKLEEIFNSKIKAFLSSED